MRSCPAICLDDLPTDAIVATNSPRRRAQLTAGWPHLRVTAVSGDANTRLRKLDGRECGAMIPAVAGDKRAHAADRAKLTGRHWPSSAPTGLLQPLASRRADRDDVRTHGGFANRMYRLDTDQGSFAVKEVNPVDRRWAHHVEDVWSRLPLSGVGRTRRRPDSGRR
ncbi:hypothetical protein [Micromonospora sp. CA-248212]|uniref:hypothetical protein n=1 Tax=Micromonospora sp. CA-248212 TaxID=3239961 RepID=UPI003D8D1137